MKSDNLLNKKVSVQFTIAKQTKDEETLQTLANSANDTVRYAVAMNPATSKKTLEKLADDDDVGVRFMAQITPEERKFFHENYYIPESNFNF